MIMHVEKEIIQIPRRNNTQYEKTLKYLENISKYKTLNFEKMLFYCQKSSSVCHFCLVIR